MSKLPKITLRILIYSSLIVSIFWVAHIHSRPLQEKEKQHSIQIIKRDIQLMWELIKVEVDLINEEAQNYIDLNGLKPGSPLPPRTFFKEADKTRRQLNTDSQIEIVKTFTASSREYSTKATTLVAVSNKVPQDSEKYAYAGIEHNYEVFGTNFTVYPEDKFAINRLKNALVRIQTTNSREE